MTAFDRWNGLDLTASRKVHVIGAGGSGMGPIAMVLHAMGNYVTGSDAIESPALGRLRDVGVTVWTDAEPLLLPDDVEAVAVSTAIPATHPEVLEAMRRGVPVLRRADALAAIAATRRTVAVAGTHGKSTTSTLLAMVLEAGDLRPSWIIGAELLGRGTGANWDSGSWFVVEADESDGTFIELGAEAVVVTNVEADHLEHYGGIDGLVAAFDSFIAGAKGPRLVCLDDPGSAVLAERFDVVTYGTAEGSDYWITDLRLDRYEASWVIRNGAEIIDVQLPAPGLHNVRNATAAAAMGHMLGVSLSRGAAGLASYGGIGRRFQKRGEHKGITFIDDYAHLPSEVEAAVATACNGGWDRIVAVFQPHRFSRTQQVGADFGASFDGVDLVVLTDVYGAGESARPGVTGEIVRNAVASHPSHPRIVYVGEREDLAAAVAKLLKAGDLCLTLGAGDVTRLADEIPPLL